MAADFTQPTELIMLAICGIAASYAGGIDRRHTGLQLSPSVVAAAVITPVAVVTTEAAVSLHAAARAATSRVAGLSGQTGLNRGFTIIKDIGAS